VNSVSPVKSIVTRAFYSAGLDRLSDRTHGGENNNAQRSTIGLAVCVETAVAVTLIVYFGWICFRGWYFDEPIITSGHMFTASLLVVAAVLGAKLFWIACSKINYWLR